ncbi:YraN family protein [Candidatus Dependentiae bacterium]
MNFRIKLGNKGEQIIAKFLEKNNFEILQQNYKSKFGEIDLIAQKDNLIAFVEVKTRKKAYFPISNVVTISKQKKISKTANLFISKNKIYNKICRFDVATVISDNNEYKINYIKNAFYSC